MMRIACFAPHYAEYATRMALGLAATDRVLLLLDGTNRRAEVLPDLFAAARSAMAVFEFRTNTRVSRRVARVSVPLRILLFRPHVLHVQEQPDQLSAIVLTLLRRFHPVVLTVHDPKPHAGRDEAYALSQDRYRRRIRGSASAYHVHGAYCAALLASAGLPDRPVVDAMHGVILTPDRSRPPPGSRRILFFGRMEAYKGLDVLIDAMAELGRRKVDGQLVLAGRGPELDRLMPAVQALGNVTLVNRYLTPAEAIEEFQAADLVVLPYREATQSGVVAAAFANGRPVVASRVGGLVDVVRDGENGLFVPAGSATALADAMVRLLDDAALRDRLAAGARHTAATALDWRAIARTLLDAYRRLLTR